MDISLEGVIIQLAIDTMILEYLLCQKVRKSPKNDGDVSKNIEHSLERFPPVKYGTN